MMWRWLDPVECRIAEQCLARGHVLEAARVLLACREPDHKSVRDLLVQIGPQLVAQTQQAYEAGDLLVAGELIACAAQCVELPLAARALQERIVLDRDQRQDADDWRNRRLQMADDWADHGRLRSALGLIEPLAEQPEADRRKLDWEQAVDRLARYSAEFHDYLAQGQFDAAAAVLKKAQQAAPGQPQVLCLEQAWRETRPDSRNQSGPDCQSGEDGLKDRPTSCADHASVIQPQTPSDLPSTAAASPAPAAAPRPIRERPPRWLLSGLAGCGEILILPQPVVTIGTPQDPWVDLPIQALLHRRHALLFREEVRGRTARYRVAPLATCSVSVNGQEVPDGQTHWLVHQDVLQFGTESCRWTFQQPVADSGTALLTQTRPAAACVVTPFGVQIRHVVLLDDELCIGRTRGAAHLIEPHLPASRLRLIWRADGLHADVDDGVLFVNDGQDREAAGPALSLPAELVLYAERAGLAQAALLGVGGMYELRLRLRG